MMHSEQSQSLNQNPLQKLPALDEVQFLKNLSDPQKYYVMTYLYPTLQEAMNMFIMEAQRTPHYEEFIKKHFTNQKPQNTSSNQISNSPQAQSLKSNSLSPKLSSSSEDYEKSSIQAQQLDQNKSSFGSYNFGGINKDQQHDKRNMMKSSKQRFASGTTFGLHQKLVVSVFDPITTFKESFLEAMKSQKTQNILSEGGKISSPLVKPTDMYLQSKRRSVFSKPYDSVNEMDDFIPPVHPKTTEQTQRLMQILKTSFLTKNLSQFELKIIADAMYLRSFQRNDMIIRYGDQGSEYYILDTGVIEVVVYQEGVDPKDPHLHKKVKFSKFLKPFVGFGEIALIYNDKRTASVRSADSCDVWVLEAKVFKHIIIKSTITRRNIELKFVEQLEIFQKIDRFNKTNLIDALESKKYNYSELVVSQGDDPEFFYIIEEGEVEMVQKTFGKDQKKTIGILTNGNHYGHLEIMNQENHSYSLKVKSNNCKVLQLNRDYFIGILDHIGRYLTKDYTQEQQSIISPSRQQPKRQSSSNSQTTSTFGNYQLGNDQQSNLINDFTNNSQIIIENDNEDDTPQLVKSASQSTPKNDSKDSINIQN
eukprot:403368129